MGSSPTVNINPETKVHPTDDIFDDIFYRNFDSKIRVYDIFSWKCLGQNGIITLSSFLIYGLFSSSWQSDR